MNWALHLTLATQHRPSHSDRLQWYWSTISLPVSDMCPKGMKTTPCTKEPPPAPQCRAIVSRSWSGLSQHGLTVSTHTPIAVSLYRSSVIENRRRKKRNFGKSVFRSIAGLKEISRHTVYHTYGYSSRVQPKNLFRSCKIHTQRMARILLIILGGFKSLSPAFFLSGRWEFGKQNIKHRKPWATQHFRDVRPNTNVMISWYSKHTSF